MSDRPYTYAGYTYEELASMMPRGEKMGTEGYRKAPVIPHNTNSTSQIEVNNGDYTWRATQQRDKRVWLVREYDNYQEINSYAVHDENIAAEVRKTIGTAEV